MDRKLNNSLIALSAAAVCLAVALLAGTPVDHGTGAEAPLAADAGAQDASGALDGPREDRLQRSTKGARRGLALPYFSFARGLRRIGG